MKHAMDRERWSSTNAFICAAIGSAIGFGNFWRFPSKCFEYGGGEFLLPYLLALILIGIPLLTLEIGLGQAFQGGNIVVFGRIHKRLRLLGFSSAWCTFCLTSYHIPLIAWFMRMLIYSFHTTETGAILWQTPDFMLSEKGIFSWVVTNVFGVEDMAGSTSGIETVWKNLACLTLAWIAVWLSVFFGIKVTGYLAYVVVMVPALIICILFLFGSSRDGSVFGVMQYVGQWDMLQLANPSIWSDAVSQIFLSLSVTLGVMTAYGSYNDVRHNVARSSCIIIGVNTAVSLVAGVAVFSALGHLAHIKATTVIDLQNNASEFIERTTIDGVSISKSFLTRNSTFPDTFPFDAARHLPFFLLDNETSSVIRFEQAAYFKWFDEWIPQSMPAERLFTGDIIGNFKLSAEQIETMALAFGTYPIVVGSLPAPHLWNALFFLALILLGIDSAFGNVESIATAILDTRLSHTYSRRQVVTVVCFLSFVTTVPYTTGMGYSILEVVNKNLQIAFLLIGLFETVAAGWIFNFYKTTTQCGVVPTVMLPCAVFIPTLVSCGIRCGGLLDDRMSTITYSVASGVSLTIVLLACTLIAQSRYGNKSIPYREKVWTLFWGNIECMRDRINGSFLVDYEQASWWRGIPKYSWSFSIKFLTPVVLLLLSTNIFCEDEDNNGYQAIGIALVSLSVFLLLLGLVVPPKYLDFLDKNWVDEEAEFMSMHHDKNQLTQFDIEFEGNAIESSSMHETPVPSLIDRRGNV